MGKKHSDTVQRMLDIIADRPGIRTPALADAVDISAGEVRQRLQAAIDAGLVIVCFVKQSTGHAQNEHRISATAPCAEGKAPDWAAFKAARRQARSVSDTPAPGGDITGAAVDRALPCDHLREATAVAAPPKPDVPVEASADVSTVVRHSRITDPARLADIMKRGAFVHELKNPPFDPEDDTDEPAFRHARRLVCSASTDGHVAIARRGGAGLVLTAEEALELRRFLADAAALLERVAA